MGKPFSIELRQRIGERPLPGPTINSGSRSAKSAISARKKNVSTSPKPHVMKPIERNAL
jgi:hypothetical protein